MRAKRIFGVVLLASMVGLAGCPADPEGDPVPDRPPPVPAVNDDPWIVEEPDSPIIADTAPENELDPGPPRDR